MIVNRLDATLAINAWGGAQNGTVLRLHNGCRPTNRDCTWTYRNYMIVSDANPRLAVNAWGGAQPGVVLRLSDQCQPSNPDCTWDFDSSAGVFRSRRNGSLVIAPAGGAVYGATLRLDPISANRAGVWRW